MGELGDRARGEVLKLPHPASPAVAIGINLVACAMQVIALGVEAGTGQWTPIVAPAIGAGVSALLAALIHAHAARERLWTEKMQADVASAKFTSAMLERQHDAMVRDFARQASTSEPRH